MGCFENPTVDDTELPQRTSSDLICESCRWRRLPRTRPRSLYTRCPFWTSALSQTPDTTEPQLCPGSRKNATILQMRSQANCPDFSKGKSSIVSAFVEAHVSTHLHCHTALTHCGFAVGSADKHMGPESRDAKGDRLEAQRHKAGKARCRFAYKSP